VRRGDLADLTAFITVAENLSFRAAAARLGVTPSALSHTMRLLEERVGGVRLLNRTTRSVSLTDAGRRLLERLHPAIDQVTAALEDLNQEREKPSGRLRMISDGATAGDRDQWKQIPKLPLRIPESFSPPNVTRTGF
jgi:DNA-binding transcriptional LysR family regulator